MVDIDPGVFRHDRYRNPCRFAARVSGLASGLGLVLAVRPCWVGRETCRPGTKHLIRRLCHAHPLPAHFITDLLRCYSLVRIRQHR
jgi:hypothetical protein